MKVVEVVLALSSLRPQASVQVVLVGHVGIESSVVQFRASSKGRPLGRSWAPQILPALQHHLVQDVILPAPSSATAPGGSLIKLVKW